MTKGRGLFRAPMAPGGAPGAEPSAAGGQLRWVSLLDAGEGVAVLTNTCAQASKPHQHLCSAGSLPWRLTRGSLHPFVWKMVAPLLQSSVLQKIKRGKVPGTGCPTSGPTVPTGRLACTTSNLSTPNCRGPAAGWWGDVASPEPATRSSVGTPGLPRLQPHIWWLSPPTEAHSFGLAPLGLGCRRFLKSMLWLQGDQARPSHEF